MKVIKMIYMDGYDEVINIETRDVIFNTKGINPQVVDNVVTLWNKNNNVSKCLFSGGTVDDYLLNEGLCTQEQRELIVESIYKYTQQD